MALGIPGTENIEILNNVNPSGLLKGAGQFILLIVLFAVVGGIFYYIYYLKKKKKSYNKSIHWFEEVGGLPVAIGKDMACELIVPGTNIPVFYVKEKKMYLPRPTIRMGQNSYWFMIKNNKEIVNFRMRNMNEDMTEANLEYDHTDMRYAYTNLKELIKRNYKDKSQPWWREYKEIISLVILIFVLTLSFIFIISKIGNLIEKVGSLINHADNLIKIAEIKASSSGVITQ